MSSQLQIEANRRNAQHSTGPRTPEGQAVSRFNALKTGIEAKSQIIPGEDSGEFDSLAHDYYLEWQPASPTECALVDDLVRADWQLRRLSRAEAQLWTHELADAAKSFNGLDEDAPLGQVVARSYHQFHFLQRRIDSAERALYRALDHLQRLRRGEPAPGSPPLTPDLQPQPAENPPASSQIGFVPSNPMPPAAAARPLRY